MILMNVICLLSMSDLSFFENRKKKNLRKIKITKLVDIFMSFLARTANFYLLYDYSIQTEFRDNGSIRMSLRSPGPWTLFFN